MKISQSQKCYQCQEIKNEVLTMNQGDEQESICEPCLNRYLNGEIAFVDAHEITD